MSAHPKAVTTKTRAGATPVPGLCGPADGLRGDGAAQCEKMQVAGLLALEDPTARDGQDAIRLQQGRYETLDAAPSALTDASNVNGGRGAAAAVMLKTMEAEWTRAPRKTSDLQRSTLFIPRN